MTGQGVKEHYGAPLAGDKSVFELAQVIERTMPEGEPEKCTGDDAKKVAAYIHEAFYSPTAQARINPPRIELSRLTVRQYRNSVADLIGSFRFSTAWNDERGLRGEYFKSRRFRPNERVIERVDPIVKFDFDEDSPDKEKIEPEEFAFRWNGSVLAPETGDYEFVIRTENGARLWLNDLNQTFIDVWVKSGTDTEHRQSIKLIGGRVYPLRLECFKSKEGKEKRASISLEWKPPHGVQEVIPARYLTPQRFAEQFVINTPFPPDDRSVGYERGAAISKEWDLATTDAAIETVAYVTANLRELASLSGNDEQDRLRRLKEFCGRFAERAFRRLLTDEQKQFFIDQHFNEATDPDTSVKRSLLLILKSPRFLFIEAGREQIDDWDIAARLSLTLWDSLPDSALIKAASAGQLHEPEQVRREAERMVSDLRCRSRIRDFFLQWLRVDQLPEISKDSSLFPEFTPVVVADLRTSLELFLDEVLWSDASDYRQLLLADSVYLNGRLAKLYGADLPADADFQKVPLDSGLRAGVLTHPYLMAGFAYTATSSPIHRGVFISRSILGRALRPPPEAVAPLAPDLAPELNTRERVILQTKPEACQSCHVMINSLGFTLEHFDAIGRFRNEEKAKPIDSTGSYITRTGDEKKFRDVKELAGFLVQSPEAHSAVVEQFFHYLVRQPIRAYGLQTPEELRDRFQQQNFHVRRLAVEIAVKAALRGATELRTASLSRP